MPHSTSRAHLLLLPLELREQVYRYVLLTPPANFKLLRTCQKIYRESCQFLYKRPLTFESMEDLIRWAERVKTLGAERLRHVTNLSVRLVVSQSPRGLHCCSFEKISSRHFTNLKHDFDALMTEMSNLRTLKILEPRMASPQQSYLDFEREFLLSLPLRYKKLESLSWSGDSQTMGFLASLQALRSISITGFSLSSPQEMLESLSYLPHLEHLEIVPCSFATTLGSRLPPPEPNSIKRSMSPEVLRQMKPLRSICFHETAIWSDEPYTFFTKDYIRALEDSHIRTLQTIKVKLNFPPAPSALAAMKRMLARSKVTHVTVGRTNFQPDVYRMILPRAIRSLGVLVDSCDGAIAALDFVRTHSREYPMLQQINLAFEQPAEKSRPDLFASDPTSKSSNYKAVTVQERNNDHHNLQNQLMAITSDLLKMGIRSYHGQDDRSIAHK